MADTQTPQELSLHDYLAQFVQDSREGKTIPLGRTLADLESYGAWRELCVKRPDIIFAITADPEGAQTLLQFAEHPENILSAIAPKEGKSLSQFTQTDAVLRQHYPTEKVSPARERAYTSLIEQERLRVAKSIQARRKIVHNFFESYQKKIFEWSPSLPEDVQKQTIQEIQILEKEATLKNFEQIRDETVRHARKFGKGGAEGEVVALIEQYAPEMNVFEIQKPLEIAYSVNNIVVKNADIITPEVTWRAIESGSNEQQALHFTRTYEVIDQARTSGADSFGEPAANIIKKEFGLSEDGAQAVFARAWERVTGAPDFLDKVGERLGFDSLGQRIVETREFQEFILEGNKYIAQYKAASGTGLFRDLASAARPADEDMQDYIAALYERARRVAASESAAPGSGVSHTKPQATAPEAIALRLPNPTEYYLAHARNLRPHLFLFEPGESPISWILRYVLGKAKIPGIGGALSVGRGGAGVKLGGGLLARFGIGKGAGAILGGPWGWALAFGDQIFSFIGRIVMGGVNRVAGGIGGWFQDATRARPKDDVFAATGCLMPAIVVALAVLVPIATTFHINNRLHRFAGLPIGGRTGAVNENPQPFNISITGTPQGSGLIPSSISYTISISALNGGQLTTQGGTVTFSVYGTGQITPPASITLTSSQLASGTYTFSIPINQQLNNSVVTATVSITANTDTQQGAIGTASTSTIIGNPPTGCFVFGGAGVDDAYIATPHASSNWGDRSKVLAAIGELAKSKSYMDLVCKGGNPNGPDMPITLYFIDDDYGGGSTYGANTIFIYRACVIGTQRCMNYTIAHESGHIIDHRTNLKSQFLAFGLPAREGYLWTYPGGFTDGEDFAETFGDYVVWKYYPFGQRHGHSGLLNYPQTYPLHYQFAKSVFGIEY